MYVAVTVLSVVKDVFFELSSAFVPPSLSQISMFNRIILSVHRALCHCVVPQTDAAKRKIIGDVIIFNDENLLARCPIPKLEDHPL
jgi:hypothetical protein